MILNIYLDDFPLGVSTKWERDVGTFEDEQWEEVLQAVQLCSMNVAQRLSQLYIVLRVHYTPARLYKMGIRPDSNCTRCTRDHGDLIHLLWRCPKLHLFWSGVVTLLNRVYLTNIPVDPKPCLLGIIDDMSLDDNSRQAILRALFQARRLILRHWKAVDPPTLKEWITQMGDTIRMERYVYQHRGCSRKFEQVWAPWLDSPGLSPVDLVMDRLLR